MKISKRLNILAAGLLLASCPAWAGVRPEAEPDDDDGQAMAVAPGDRIQASFSYARGQETRRGSDRDSFRLGGLAFPGAHVLRVVPGAKDCRFYFGLGNYLGPFSGEVSLSVSMDDKGKTTYLYSGGGAADWKRADWSKDPANGGLLLLEPVLYNSDKNGGYQCSKDGPIYKEIPYELLIDADGGTALPPIPDLPKADGAEALPKAVPDQLTLGPGKSWEGSLPRSGGLEFSARIAYAKPAGAASALEVWVNGKPVTTGLRNKRDYFQLADGRVFPYYAPAPKAWNLFYSPDFTRNDSTAGGLYEVITDPGQAYLYRFDLGPAQGAGGAMKVLLKHNGKVKADIVIKGR